MAHRLALRVPVPRIPLIGLGTPPFRKAPCLALTRSTSPAISAHETAHRYMTTSSRHREAIEVHPPETLSDAEKTIFNKIKAGLAPVSLKVEDISGGCGSMYAFDIVSRKFAGLSVIKQHKLVNQVLADEIKGMHGLQMKTKAP